MVVYFFIGTIEKLWSRFLLWLGICWLPLWYEIHRVLPHDIPVVFVVDLLIVGKSTWIAGEERFERQVFISPLCESRSSGNEVICRTHSTHTYYTSFTNPVHWSILRQGASHRFSLYCILLFCIVLCIVSAVDYSVWHSEAHYGIQCVNASQPVRGTMDSRQPPNSDRQTPQLCSINCNELFRNAYTACFATHWSIMHIVGENTNKKKT